MLSNVNVTNYLSTQQRKNAINSRNVSFSGHFGIERCPQYRFGYLVNETGFFRDLQTMKYVKEYIKNEFKDKNIINILVAGCSTGEQPFSYSMFLKDLGKKINILAFDISPNNIKRAKNGIYRLESYTNANMDKLLSSNGISDYYLWKKPDVLLSEEEKANKALFKENFTMLVNKFINNNDKKIVDNRKYYIRNYAKLEYRFCKLKPNKINNVEFVLGDLNNIDTIGGNKDYDIILMTNTLYHLVTICTNRNRTRSICSDAYAVIDKIIKKVRDKLSEGGILVVGEAENETLTNNTVLPNVMCANNFDFLNSTNEHPENVFRKSD